MSADRFFLCWIFLTLLGLGAMGFAGGCNHLLMFGEWTLLCGQSVSG